MAKKNEIVEMNGLVEIPVDENNKKSKKDKEDKKGRTKGKKLALLISGFAVTFIQLIATLIFIFMLHFVDVLPTDLKVLIDVLLVLFCFVTFLMQRWTIPGIITKILGIAIAAALIIGSVLVNRTYHALEKITKTEKTSEYKVFVMASSPYKELKDVENETFGILRTMNRETTNKAIANVEEKLGKSIQTVEYDTPDELALELYSSKVSVILMDYAYTSSFVDIEGLQNFDSDVRSIYDCSFIEKITEEPTRSGDGDDDKPKGLDYKRSDHVFTIYVSGIDFPGSPAVNRNSDVNILMTVNTKTHQIYLLNTPRDYCMPLSVSNGELDKLTHAGGHGIDCSVKTLEMFYGIDIQYYFKVNFTGFVQIIDQLGGVDVVSPKDFVSTHGKYHFTQGVNHMNGQQALGFSRERYSFGTGDNQRGRNQMAVIEAVLKKLGSSELLKNYSSILDAVSGSMITSMSYDQITDLIKMMLDEGFTWDVQQYAVIGHGTTMKLWSLKTPNYAMIPDQNSVDIAMKLFKAIYNDEIIKGDTAS